MINANGEEDTLFNRIGQLFLDSRKEMKNNLEVELAKIKQSERAKAIEGMNIDVNTRFYFCSAVPRVEPN